MLGTVGGIQVRAMPLNQLALSPYPLQAQQHQHRLHLLIHCVKITHSLSVFRSLSLWASVCLCKCVRTGFELFLQDVNCWSVKQLEWDGKLSKSRIMPNHQFISSTSTLQNHSLSVCLSVSLSLDLSLAVCVFVCSVFTTFHHPFRTVVLS